jgi:glycosyltransferase involved in cell wall biosynthesis
MRVLLLAPHPPDPHGPGAIPVVVHAQMTALCARHDVTLVTIAGPDERELATVDRLAAAGVDVHAVRRTEPHALASGRRWVRDAARWLVTGLPMRTVWFREPGVQRTIDRLLAERRFDVVHASDNAMAAYDVGRTAPTLLTEQEVRAARPVDWSRWARGNWYRGTLDEVDWHRWPRYQRRVWRRFDRLEVFTPRDACAVAALAPELASRVHVNPFAIELPPAADPAMEEPDTIVFIGHFLHAPNVDAARWLASEIMPRLRVRAPGVRLRIVGADPNGAVRRLVAPDITVTGFVPDAGLELARAAIVMAPVRIGGGQRMKVLHSMALGKAVVTTTRGAEGLLLDDASPPIAIADTADAIADATASLLAAPSMRRELGARARALVAQRHSVEAYGDRLDASYAALRSGTP